MDDSAGEREMGLTARVRHLRAEGAYAVLAQAQALEAEGRDIINLGIGQPDFRTPQHIVDAAKRALELAWMREV